MVSLRQQFGQMVMLGFDGTAPADKGPQKVRQLYQEGAIGWVIEFERNVTEGMKALAKLNKYLSDSSHVAHGAAPMLSLGIAIDGEGGRVHRLKEAYGYDTFVSAKEVAETMSPEQAEAYYQKMAQQYAKAGINFNLAPVVDVESWVSSGCIGRYQRSYGAALDSIALYARAFMKAHHGVGLPTCIKHWPGLGADRGDTHQSATDITAYWQEKRDTAPFVVLKDEAPSVMVSHAHNGAWDKNHIASLSRTTLQKLRYDVGFDGLILTDALEMKATAHYEWEEMVWRAVYAGNDVLIFANNPVNDVADLAMKASDYTIPLRAWQAVEKKLDVGDSLSQVIEENIRAAYRRILAFKEKWFAQMPAV